MSALADDAPRGFVRMSEYLKLQRRCDELEEQLAYAQEGEPALRSEATIWKIREATGFSRRQSELVLILAQSSTPLSGAALDDALEVNSHMSTVLLSKMRSSRRDGVPVFVPRGRAWAGYQLTTEARAWLKERVPEAFVHNRGLSR